MKKTKRNVRYVFAEIFVFVFVAGILSGCLGPDYTPATIEFTSPVDGAILPPGTESVTIEGYVQKGDSNVAFMTVPKKTFPFFKIVKIESDMTFTYDFELDPDAIYSTCTFKVVDKKLIANHNRISFAVGNSASWDDDGVDNGIKLSLTEEGLNEGVGALLGSLNDWKNALIFGDQVYVHPKGYGTYYGCSGDPLCEELVPEIINMLENTDKVNCLGKMMDPPSLLPLALNLDITLPIIADITWMIIAPGSIAEYKERGHLAIGRIGNSRFDILPENNVKFYFSIFAEDGVNPESSPGTASLYAYGYNNNDDAHHSPHIEIVIEDDIEFEDPITANIISNEDGISISPDFSNAKLSLHTGMIDAEYGSFNGVIDLLIDGALLFFESFVHEILRDIAGGFFNSDTGSILNFETLELSLEGVDFNISPMDDAIYTNNSLLAVRLRMDARPQDISSDFFVNPENLNYLTTGPTETDGEWSFLDSGSDQQLLLVASDDMLNKTLFSIFQSGLVTGYDEALTESLKDFLGDLSNEELSASLSLTVPPVCDFSGGDDSEFGKIIVPNMIIDITNLLSLKDGIEHQVKLSVDLEAIIEIGIDDDGSIFAGINKEASSTDITIMYENFGNAGMLPSIGTHLANEVVNTVVESIVDDFLLSIVNDLHLNINEIRGELVDNCLYLRINPDA